VEELDLSTQEIKEMIIQAQEETETEPTKLEGEIDQELQSMPSGDDELTE
jgi:hypothetical protein